MGSCTPEFLENHPHSRQLLRIVRDCPAQIGLEQFAEFIEERTGIEVILDKAALQDEGVPFETVLFLDRVEGISVRSVLKEALGPQGLTYLLDGKILRITTQVKACETMSNIVYPVLDLIQSEPLPSPHRLANPYLDLEDAARRRIESRLKRVISADFQDTPLEEVLDVIGQKIGAQIRIDKGALQDEGITIDTQITLQLANLPAATIVTESLEPHGLTTIIENEMLKVTTQVRADEKMSSRIYSLAGLDSTSGSSLSRKNASLRWDGLVATSYLSGAGAAGGIVAQESPDQGLHANFASLSGNVLTPDSQTASAAPESIDDQILDWLPRHKPGHAVHDMISLIQQTAHGKWMEIDQEGGTINSFPLSQSLVIQQTQSVHREIEQTLAKLRRHVTNDLPWQPRTPDWKGRTQGDYLPLQQIIVAKSGKWMDIDQEGGAIVPHLPSNTLVIRQEMHVHEEISSVLTQLRRSRYLAETLQYRQTLQGIDDTSLFDLPSLTELPRHDGTVRPNRSADEIKWLASRQIPASLNQRWRSISKSTRQQRALSIRRTDTSLELGLPDRIMRAEKLRAAIAYPGLTLVEIDEWGPAVRQIADAALPWLPHRSNEELADLFDVTLVEETPQAITLRLNFPGNPDTYLQPTCSKATKMPVKWLAVAGNQLQFELKFDSKSVVAIDPKGNELERWELISDQPPIAILALQDGWGESLVVDMSVPNSPYQKARDLLQAADYEMAMRALQEALTEKPNQPLLSFLLAWCCSFTDTDAANLRLMKSCLQHVAMSDAHDLVRLVTPVNFPSAGTMSVLLSIPEDRRSAEVWTLLAETTRIAEKPQLALTFLNRALKLSSDLAATRRGKLLQVELLLQTNQLPLAIDAQKSMTDLTDSQIIYLANLFARSGEYEIADLLFERFRQQAKPAGIILAQLLGQQAEYCQQPRRRRELLLQAATLSPPQHEIRTKFLTDLFERTDGDEDARQLGELAQMQQDVSIQTRLRMRQAELLQDREQAGQIVMDLIRRDRLQHDRLTWALQILDSAEFSDDIIKLVERQLRTNAPQERRAKQILKEVVIRFAMPDPTGSYHIPLMLAPNSYSVWWSS